MTRQVMKIEWSDEMEEWMLSTDTQNEEEFGIVIEGLIDALVSLLDRTGAEIAAEEIIYRAANKQLKTIDVN